MAQLIERILVWVAILVAAAALVAVILNFLPGKFGGLSWLHAGTPTQTQASAMDMAEQAISRGDAPQALALAQRAVQESPTDASVANRAGNVAQRANDPQTAERYYRAGESADPHYPWNFVALGQLYEQQGKKELADAQLRVATATAPDQPFIHYDLGVVELEEGLYAAALSDFEIELRRSPTYRPATIGRAEALEKLGRKSEAVALYRRVGVDPRNTKTRRPLLTVKPIAAPSPSPAPSPPPSPVPTPTKVIALARPSPTPTLTHAHTTIVETPIAIQTPTPARPPWATATPKGGIIATAPTSTPLSIVSGDARSYLLDVTQDLGFTRSLPEADASQTSAVLNTRLNFALASRPPAVEAMLNVGAAALLSGRMALASKAFSAAEQAAPNDWRGPYYAGLTAQANGDMQQAATLFGTALSRQGRAEIYTSLAVVELQTGDIGSAAVNANRATQVNPAYEPGRFVAGMIDLILTNVPDAKNNLAAAQALGGAPQRTAYFLAAVSQKT